MFLKKMFLVSLLLLFILVGAPLLAEERADQPQLNPDRSSGPWLVQEDDYFRFVYKKADEKALEVYLSVSREAYETVTGFFKLLPPEKPVVILYGTQDDPPFGGVTAGLPLRIGQQLVAVNYISAKTLLIHEFTHYMQITSYKTGWLLKALGVFSWDLSAGAALSLKDVSYDGTTSFLEGNRLSEYGSLPIRAAVLEGQMWDYDQVSNTGLNYPRQLRVYFSGMLIQNWIYDYCGDEGFWDIANIQDESLITLESLALEQYTGLDLETIWGDIRVNLNTKYAFANSLPKGRTVTPRSGYSENYWGPLQSTEKGYLHVRGSLDQVGVLGFWRPDVKTSDKNRGLLVGDPGEFIPLEGVATGLFSVNKTADRIAFIKNAPETSPLWHSENHNKLYLADIEWTGGESRARAVNVRQLPGQGFFDCLLSPEGSRLFVTQRYSQSYLAFEYNLEDNTLSPLNLPPNLSVDRLSISPDGRYLAVDSLVQGQYDVGIYDLENRIYTTVTSDEAFDSRSGFLSDGRFIFTSDRENTMAAYSYESGVFTRELIESIAVFNPVENETGGFYYSSYSAYGNVIRLLDASQIAPEVVPGFLELRPSWLERRDEIWDHYREKGANLPGNLEKAKVPALQEAPQPFLDIAVPKFWYPAVSLDSEDSGYGAAIQGNSYLGENTYAAQLLYHPLSQQLSGVLYLSLAFPLLTSTVQFQQLYYSSTVNSATFYNLQRKYSLGLNYPLLRHRNLDNSLMSMSLTGGAVLTEAIQGLQPFDLAESLAMLPRRDLLLGLGFSLDKLWPGPAVAFQGGSSLGSAIQGFVEWADLPGNATLGSGLDLQASLLLGQDLITLSASSIWREAGNASGLLPRTVPRWNKASDSVFYGEMNLEWLQTWLDKEFTAYFFLTELGALSSGVKAFWEADLQNGFRWLPELEFYFDYMFQYNFYYHPDLFKIGIGYRHDLTAPLDQFDPGNICVRFGLDMAY